jgi:hypothetical protein
MCTLEGGKSTDELSTCAAFVCHHGNEGTSPFRLLPALSFSVTRQQRFHGGQWLTLSKLLLHAPAAVAVAINQNCDSFCLYLCDR